MVTLPVVVRSRTEVAVRVTVSVEDNDTGATYVTEVFVTLVRVPQFTAVVPVHVSPLSVSDQATPRALMSPATVAVKFSEWPASSDCAVDGSIWMAMELEAA